MYSAPPPVGSRPATAATPTSINLDTADMALLVHSLARPAGQPRPQLLIDCGALERGRTLGVCDVVSRLLVLRQSGAGISLRNVGPVLRRSLRLLELGPLFSLVGQLMELTTVSTDPGYVRPAQPSRLHRWLSHYVQDERDMPFVYLLLKISATLLPLAGALFVPALRGGAWWAVASLYLLLGNLRYKGPFGLMLHCTSHRVLFKKKYGWLNKYLPWVIGPLFGQTPETYFTHHLGMHHPENNLPDDTSSTLFYQRDSWVDFLRYLGDFLVLGVARLAGYLARKQKVTLRARLLRGELSYLAAVLVLGWVNLPATLVVLVVPLVLARVVMMLGNWAQHAFIAPESPGNCYTNSVTCINTNYNHKCWNDGYHISHHLKPALHWTDHPAHFRQHLAQYASNEAIVFDGIHFLHIFGYLMGRRYDLLARHFVDLTAPARSEREIVALLRSRTQRLPRPVAQRAAALA